MTTAAETLTALESAIEANVTKYGDIKAYVETTLSAELVADGKYAKSIRLKDILNIFSKEPDSNKDSDFKKAQRALVVLLNKNGYIIGDMDSNSIEVRLPINFGE